MGMRWTKQVVAIGCGALLLVPSAHAAEERTTETSGARETNDQIRSAIEAETDPELKQVMKEQLHQMESGQFDPRRDAEVATGASRDVAVGGPASNNNRLTGGGPLGRPIEANANGSSSMAPELKDKLSQVSEGVASGRNDRFDREVSGGLRSAEGGTPGREQALEQAERFLKEHGTERPGVSREALERASGGAGSAEHELGGSERQSRESLQRETQREGWTRDTGREATQHESIQREGTERERQQDLPQRELSQRDASEHEQAPRELPQREAPQHEAPPHEMPQFEAPH